MKQCHFCKEGEHENYDNDIKLIVLLDPETHKRVQPPTWACSEHRQSFEDDGYKVQVRS